MIRVLNRNLLPAAYLLMAAGCTPPLDTDIDSLAPDNGPWANCLATADGKGADTPSTTVDRLPPTQVVPNRGYAEGQLWFENNEHIELFGGKWMKFGRLLSVDPDGLRAKGIDLRKVGTVHGVPVYAERDAPRLPPLVLYIPVRTCVFQAYQDDRPDTEDTMHR